MTCTKTCTNKYSTIGVFGATFHLTLSPPRRITAPRLFLALVHIYGEAESPALGIWSAMAGRQGTVCDQKGSINTKYQEAKRPKIDSKFV